MGAKGEEKTPGSGRHKGTPNKKTQLLQEKLDEAGVDPFKVLMDLCNCVDPTLRATAAKELCQYILPKRKALELNADVDIGMIDRAKAIREMSREEQIKLLRDELKRLENE